MSPSIVPLKVWYWTAALFLLFQGGIFGIHNHFEAQEASKKATKITKQLENIEHAFLRAPNSYKIVAIGSSLFEAGLASASTFDSIAKASHASPIELGLITDYPDPIQYLIEEKDLVAQLIAAKPDLVCIQTELAAITFPGNNFSASDSSETIWYQKFQELSHVNRSVVTHIRESFREKKKRNRLVQRDTLLHTPDKRLVKSYQDMQFLFEGIAKLKKAGIEVVIVDIPKPARTEAIVFTEAFTKQLDQLLATYDAEIQVAHWAYDGKPLYYSYYKDFGHMNQKGKTYYTNWFLRKVMAHQAAL